MKKSIFFFGALFIISSASLAQNADSTRLRGRLKQMSPSQRQELRKELRSKWDSLSPEQKEKVKTGINQLKTKYDSLPPEQKEMIKQKMQQRRADTTIKRTSN